MDAAWNAVTDGGSGLAGYSVEWSKATNTTPDVFLDTAGPTTTSSALPDSDLWYVHVAAVDKAGNVSGQATWGRSISTRWPPSPASSSLEPLPGDLPRSK